MYEFVLLNMAKEFSDTPGGRYIKDGKFSGEAFRENLLKPKYLEAMNENKRLVILISGCYGLTAWCISTVIRFTTLLRKCLTGERTL